VWVAAEIGRRVRIEAEIVAAAGVQAAVAGDVDAGAVDGRVVVGAGDGTGAAAGADGTRAPIRAPISAADFADCADK
jgi:hypothetical protein